MDAKSILHKTAFYFDFHQFFLHIAAPAIGICDDAVYKEEFDIILQQLDKVTERIENIEDRQGIRHKEDTPEEAIDILEEEMEEFVDILDEVEKKDIMDQLEFRAELRTRLDWYDFKGHNTIPFTGITSGNHKHEIIYALPNNLAAFYANDRLLFTQGNDSLGYLYKYTFFIESKEFFGFNFDWFAGLSYLKTHGTSAVQFMLDPGKLGLPYAPVPAREAYNRFASLSPNHAAQLKELQNAPTPIGLLNNDGTSDHDAHCIHIGGRFDVPLPISHPPKLGIEYNHGSQYWANFGEASEDPLHKLATRGEAWDLYLLQPVSRYFMLRFGHTVTRNDYDQNLSFYYGEPLAIDHQITNTYLLLDAKF
jgi:Protein of unknown function (DUF3373).